jgi:hypothetical protein
VPDETALFLPPAERGNRKEKSLGLLAERMLQNYPFMLEPGNPTQIHLDDTARMLNTERRRIYDIVNVLEAVQMMSKVSTEVSFSVLGIRDILVQIRTSDQWIRI